MDLISVIEAERPDVILLCGDIFEIAKPSAAGISAFGLEYFGRKQHYVML